MKKVLFNSLAIVSLLAIYSCSKEPTACFTASESTVEEGTSISFKNCSEDGEEYQWTFGDGGSSSTENPNYTYTNSGIYTVELKASNGSKDNSTSKTITVEEKDLCKDVICVYGDCVDGTCECEEGYQGSLCNEEKTPKKIIIKKVTVLDFAATANGGAGWDLSSGADIYFDLHLGNTEIYDALTPIGYFEDANSSLDYEFVIPNGIEINNPTESYAIQLWDYDDLDTDDWMGGVSFTPYSNGGGFPSELILAPTQSWYAFKLDLEYEW